MYCMSRASALHRFSDTMALECFCAGSLPCLRAAWAAARSVPHQFVPTSKSRVADFAGARHESYKVSSELASLSAWGLCTWEVCADAQALATVRSLCCRRLRVVFHRLPCPVSCFSILFSDRMQLRIDYTSRHCPSAANAQA